MIFIGTKVTISDNSGGLSGICIHVYKKLKGATGDLILISLKRIKPKRKLERGQLLKALVVRSNSIFKYNGNHSISCFINSVILLKKNNDLYGNRFKGPIFHKLVEKKLSKALSLSENIY